MTKTLESPGQRKALGRGLDALLGPQPTEPAAAPPAGIPPAGEKVALIPTGQIQSNAYQPRRAFDEDRLRELAESIREDGVIQPVVVQRTGDHYTLVVGERRWLAAQMAGLKEIPALVREIPEDRMLEIMLVENIQREDLNPMEVAHALERMMQELHLSHEEIAQRTGKDRVTVTNLVRLLKLPLTVQEMVAEGRLSMGHARALLALSDARKQEDLAKKAVMWNLSVRRLELMVRHEGGEPQGIAAPPLEKSLFDDPNVRNALAEMERVLGTRVTLIPKNSQRGKLEIQYYSEEDLNRIYEVIVRP